MQLLKGLDEIVREGGGAVYSAKDARMSAQNFQQFFPHWKSFPGLSIRNSHPVFGGALQSDYALASLTFEPHRVSTIAGVGNRHC